MRGLPVADGDRPCLIEQEGIQVTGCLYWLTALGDNVGPEGLVHARNSDRTQQSADRSRDQAYEQRNKSRNIYGSVGIIAEWLQGNADDDKDQRETSQQDRQGDLIQRLLPGCALHQGNHLIQEAFTGLRGDSYLDLIAEHFGPAA